MNKDKIVKILISEGYKILDEPYQQSLTNVPEADVLLNDLDNFPHAFVLGCVMDTQIKAEKAWIIPYKISQQIGGFDFKRLLKLDLNTIKNMFKQGNLHRFNDKMAENFYLAIELIHTKYSADASNIWKNQQNSLMIIKRFREFKGAGVKVSTMAVNILRRRFKIPIKYLSGIDISPDVHIKRVMGRLGLVSVNASNDEITQTARRLHPDYPGVFDLSIWRIGRDLCGAGKPQCEKCYLNEYCPKNIFVTG